MQKIVYLKLARIPPLLNEVKVGDELPKLAREYKLANLTLLTLPNGR